MPVRVIPANGWAVPEVWCGQAAIGVGETSSCHRSCGTGTFARRVQHRVRQIGGVEERASAIPPPMEVDNTSDRIQHLEALVAELRKERDDLRSHSAESKRAGELARSPWTVRVGSRSVGRVATVDHVHICKDVDGHGAGRFRPCCRAVCTVSKEG